MLFIEACVDLDNEESVREVYKIVESERKRRAVRDGGEATAMLASIEWCVGLDSGGWSPPVEVVQRHVNRIGTEWIQHHVLLRQPRDVGCRRHFTWHDFVETAQSLLPPTVLSRALPATLGRVYGALIGTEQQPTTGSASLAIDVESLRTIVATVPAVSTADGDPVLPAAHPSWTDGTRTHVTFHRAFDLVTPTLVAAAKAATTDDETSVTDVCSLLSISDEQLTQLATSLSLSPSQLVRFCSHLQRTLTLLKACGVSRVLTSGGPGKAVEYPGTLALLATISLSLGGPTIVAAGGIRANNILTLRNAQVGGQTPLTWFHASVSGVASLLQTLRGE